MVIWHLIHVISIKYNKNIYTANPLSDQFCLADHVITLVKPDMEHVITLVKPDMEDITHPRDLLVDEGQRSVFSTSVLITL